MRYDPDRNHRRSIRLEGYDYSTPGAYFVTLCVEHRECLFGPVAGDAVEVNEAGEMIGRWWSRLPEKFPALGLDEWILMPNHLHGILFLQASEVTSAEPPARLGNILGWLKTMTTNEYLRGVKTLGWRCFPGRLWQRDFFDRILRSQVELDRAREYIRKNPFHWDQDTENPSNQRS